MISTLSAIFVTATSTRSFANSSISLEQVSGSSENTIGFVTEDGPTSSSSASHLRCINIDRIIKRYLPSNFAVMSLSASWSRSDRRDAIKSWQHIGKRVKTFSMNLHASSNTNSGLPLQLSLLISSALWAQRR